ESRHTHCEQCDKAAGVILPLTAAGGREIAERQAESQRKTERQHPQGHRDGQGLRNNVAEGMVSIFEREIEICRRMMPLARLIFLPNQTEAAEVLLQDRPLEAVSGLARALDFRRGGPSSAVERSA